MLTETTKELKTWKKYLEVLDKENEPILDMFKEWAKKDTKLQEEYKTKVAHWEELERENDRKQEEREKKGFLTRLCTNRPENIWYTRPLPPLYMSSFVILSLIKKPSYEEFLTWCVKGKL